MQADIINLFNKYYEDARRAIYMSSEEDEVRSKRNDKTASHIMERSMNMKTMGIKTKTRAGGRCCVCFDPFSIQNVSKIIAFYCCHAYHMTCLMDSANTADEKKTPAATSHKGAWYYEYDDSVLENVDDNDIATSCSPQMRCILCTTAASKVH